MSKIEIDKKTDALIAVDLQNDFCPGSALAVPNGEEVIPVINRWLAIDGLFKVATRDWHPADHCSFKEYGGTWPPHCVQNTPGAEYHPDLDASKIDLIISTADNPDKEAYSGFDGTDLESELKLRGIKRLFIGGLATEYCVKSTVLDALKAGFEVVVIKDAIRGIEVNNGDCEKAMSEMRKAGATFVKTEEILD